MFTGFNPLSANFTLTPNQFFDEIVGYCEPCVMVVVAVLIRETLGWENKTLGGRKVETELSLSAFVRHGLSQESARKGIKKAIEAGFIIQTSPPSPKDPARYALKWNDDQAQEEAIKLQRRALGTTFSKSGGLIDEGKRRSRSKKRRVLDSSTLKNSTQISSTLDICTLHIDKKSVSKNKRQDQNKDQTLNVVRPALRFSLSKVREESVDAIINLTRDEKSRMRFEQLWNIAEQSGNLECWEDAYRAVETRLKKDIIPIERPGAYFQTVVTALLNGEGVAVPVGNRNERHEIRRLAIESLGPDVEEESD